ncbi:histone H2A-beta, sperm-like [Sardina pilchardus]|uniref:histone H2A-beta, sperm-like n=1 Tax=Sardina pilchardus TaxID=27697 RepID=UPI002E115380
MTMVKASELAGLHFSVGKVERQLSTHQERFTPNAAVYLAATLEYLTAELLELFGYKAKDDRKECISPCHIKQAIVNDEELKGLLQEIYISNRKSRVAAAKRIHRRRGIRRRIGQRNKGKPGRKPKEMASPSRQQPSSS